MKKILLALTLGLSLGGCGLIYRIDVPQGNYLEQNQLDKLKPGMNQDQVKFVMGTPMLKDSFSKGTWYYKYEFRPGNGKAINREVKLYFNDKGLLQSAESNDFNIPATLKKS